jgi:hypothetical protein
MAQSYRDYMDIGSDLMLSGNFTKAIEMFDKVIWLIKSQFLSYLKIFQVINSSNSAASEC